MEPKEILIRARKLIDHPDKWIKGMFTFGGGYCAVGALFKAGIDRCGIEWDKNPAYLALVKSTGTEPGEVGRFNDTHTHAEVLAAFDRAIASLD
jgi:hypothetical protein